MSNFSHTKQLTRDTRNARVTGVCAGIARFFDFDVSVVRIVTVLSMFVIPGVSAVAYVVASLVMPRRTV